MVKEIKLNQESRDGIGNQVGNVLLPYLEGIRANLIDSNSSTKTEIIKALNQHINALNSHIKTLNDMLENDRNLRQRINDARYKAIEEKLSAFDSIIQALPNIITEVISRAVKSANEAWTTEKINGEVGNSVLHLSDTWNKIQKEEAKKNKEKVS